MNRNVVLRAGDGVGKSGQRRIGRVLPAPDKMEAHVAGGAGHSEGGTQADEKQYADARQEEAGSPAQAGEEDQPSRCDESDCDVGRLRAIDAMA